MARKRLGPPRSVSGTATGLPTPSMPPIAQVAGESATEAALREVSDALAAAREDGRLLRDIPLDDIDPGHLQRDRLALDETEMAALMTSLSAHGQRTPIELQALEEGTKPWGLISGWRRLTALKHLHGKTGEARFATIRALIRRDAGAEAAYLSMIEENEIRAGLSHYERARIAALTAARGIFPDPRTAIARLFASGSRARRSKIGSFLLVHEHLDDLLNFPSHIPERLGLRLAELLKTETGRDLIRLALPPELRETPEQELAALARILDAPGDVSRAKQPAGHGALMPREVAGREIAPGIRLKLKPGRGRLTAELSGPGVDEGLAPVFEAALEQALKKPLVATRRRKR